MVTTDRPTVTERSEHRGDDVRRVGESAAAGHPAGEIAAARRNDERTARSERGDVPLGGRMVPHIHIHRGGEHDGRGGSEIEGGEKVIGQAVGELGERVRSSRCDDEKLCRLRLGDVLDGGVFDRRGRSGRVAVGGGPEAGDDLMTRESREGQRPHKLLRRARHHDMRIKSYLLQRSDEVESLIGGDPAAHPDGNLAANWIFRRVGLLRVRCAHGLHPLFCDFELKFTGRSWAARGARRQGIALRGSRRTTFSQGSGQHLDSLWTTALRGRLTSRR